MPVMVAESSTISENNNNRYMRKPPKIQQPISELDLNPPQIRSKPIISSLLLSTLTPTTDGGSAGAGGSGIASVSTTKKKKFTSTTFRGLGCTASSQVSVPAAIRTSANWEGKKVRKKKQKKLAKEVGPNQGGVPMLNSTTSNNPQSAAPCSSSSSCLVVPDVWCGPGSGFTTDAASVDCVVSRRPVSARGKVDSDRIHPRERPLCTARRMVNPDEFSFYDTDTDPDTSHPRMDVFGSRHHRHARHRSPEGLAEIVMLQSNLMMGGGRRSFGLDRFRDWRLDVDSMSYEELLELGEKIGYVSTGLREDEIIRCLRKAKLSTQMQWKCSICQEEYETEEEMGKLDCEHLFHVNCIKQWLAHKKTCPICKTSAVSPK